MVGPLHLVLHGHQHEVDLADGGEQVLLEHLGQVVRGLSGVDHVLSPAVGQGPARQPDDQQVEEEHGEDQRAQLGACGSLDLRG